MKRFVFVSLMIVSAVALFATGAVQMQAEVDDDAFPGWGRGYMDRPFGPGFAGDGELVWNPVELTGTIEFIDEHPVLKVDGKTYLIGSPMAMMYADEIEEGTEVIIRGQLIEDLSSELVEYNVDGMIMAEQAEIDGEVIALGREGFASGFGGPGMMDRRGFDLDERNFGRRPSGGRMPMGRW